MALVFKDRVRVTSTTTGTGTITLGSAVSGFQDFSVIGDGNTTYYSITDQAGNWEVGIGTYTASGTTLSRDTVLESSNSNSLVNFPSGTKNVFVTYPADKSVARNAAGTLSLSAVVESTSGGFKFPDGTTQTTAATASTAKTWTAFTSSGSYTVPTGVTSIRAYAFGAGANGIANNTAGVSHGGGGGGCAYGDIAVTAGQTVTISVSGVATVSYGGTTMLTGNAASGTTGGTASKHATVTNGGAYSGGSGGIVNGSGYGGGGGASGSPLGVGGAGGGSSSVGGGGGGAGGVGASSYCSGGGGLGGYGIFGAGAGAGGIGGTGVFSSPQGGPARSPALAFTDPIFANCLEAGGNGVNIQSSNGTISYRIAAGNGGNGGGGGGYANEVGAVYNVAYAGHGGSFGGGGGAYSAYGSAFAGNGGFGGGGGGCYSPNLAMAGNGGYGGGGGGCNYPGGGGTAGTGGPAIVLIYA